MNYSTAQRFPVLSPGRRARLEALRAALIDLEATEQMRGSCAPTIARIDAILSGMQAAPEREGIADILPRISAILDTLPEEQSILRRGMIQCEGAIRVTLGIPRRERMTAHRGREVEMAK